MSITSNHLNKSSESSPTCQNITIDSEDCFTITYRMGNSLKKSVFNPPLTFRECYVDGKLDIARYFLYRRRLEENEDAMAMVSEIYFKVKSKRKRKAETMSSSVVKKPRVHSRSVKRH